MRVVDLSHEIHSDIPVYPGTAPPTLTPTNSIVQDGFAETLISMYSHTGTHMDAPAHIFSAGRSLDQFPAGQFFGQACVADVSRCSGREISVDALKRLQPTLTEVDFLLLKTDWSHHWGSPEYFQEFPFLSCDSAEWICQFSLKGVGIDTISVDRIENEALPAHHQLLAREILIIENLTNLAAIHCERFFFSCLPLKLRAADGSPVRAVAIETEGGVSCAL